MLHAGASKPTRIKWSQLHVSDSACHGFGRLLPEVNRSRSSNRNCPLRLPFSSSPVYQAMKRLKDSRKSVDLVQDNQPILILRKMDTTLVSGIRTSSLGQKAPRPLNAGLLINKLQNIYPEIRMRSLADSLSDWGAPRN